MAFKNYYVSPAIIDTDTVLIPTLSGVDVVIATLQISAVTMADVIIKRNNGTSDYQSETMSISAGNTVILDHKIVVPDGHSFVVQSDQTDTEFTANVDEA